MEPALRFRWLGNSGLVWTFDGHTLAHDPFLTRPPLHKVFWGRVEPDRALVERHLPICDDILVTAARWDHFMDVPAVAQRTGARCYGPARVCELLETLGVPQGQVYEIQAGDRLELGPFRVHALPGEHTPTPLDRFLNGPLPGRLEPPLRIRDYRMADRTDQLCYWIGVGGTGWQLARPRALPNMPLGEPADVLVVMPFETPGRLRRLMANVRPRLVIPYHWDNLFRPLSRLPRAALPLLTRIGLDWFARRVAALGSGVKTFIPQVLDQYDLADLLAG